MSRQFLIYSVDALDLVYNQNLNLKQKNTKYILDLSKFIPHSVKIERRDDNALFHQMCLALGYNFSSGDPDERILLQKIVVVDFSRIFIKMNMERCDVEKLAEEISDPKDSSSWGAHLSRMLDSKSGITIKFSSKEKGIFIPFHKSASMAKKSRITYILKSMKPEMDKRLSLDIDFSDIPMSLSKYYAYCGLYLTSGIRVDLPENLQLNEETMIVLPDITVHPSEEYDGVPLAFTQIEGPGNDKTGLHRFEIREKTIEATAFDGEGLVSPAFARCFQKAIGYDNVNCFQFRAPFTKGMLFCGRDFQEFFAEFCEGDDPVVNDFLGIPRHLKKAHIIICESIFKCHDWLRVYCEGNKKIIKKDYNSDPMCFYFSKLRQYDHSIYISGHNGSFCPNGVERLNYQFLDTLKLSHEDMEKLVKDHLTIGLDQLRVYLHPHDNPYDEYAQYTAKSYIAAADMNPAFYSEARLKDDALQQMRNIRLDCGSGKLYTQGEHRYLSSDLIVYLLYIVTLTYGADPRKFNYDDFFGKLQVLSGCFYMPQAHNEIFHFDKDKYYAIFRSPHLSRNEECVLHPYIPIRENDIYERYFGELTGVLMVPIGSLVPNICSGADFDGDTVKIYSNETIVNAVIAGGYDKHGKRTLPVVDIPVANPIKEKPTNELAFKALIINTFCSYVGKLSNLSVTFADKEYNYLCENTSAHGSLCAEVTAVTGLEIDSVKNNGKPRANIQDLDEKSRHYGNQGKNFVKCKNAINSVRGLNYKKTVFCTENKFKFDYSNFEKPLYIYKPKPSSHSIMLLPYYFAEYDCKAKDSEYLKANKYLTEADGNSTHFIFESDKPPLLDEQVLSNTKDLISAYLNLNTDIRSYNRKLLTMTKSYPKLRTILSLKYDSFDEKIRYDDRILDFSVENALDNSIEMISSCLKESRESEAAIQKAKESWLFSTKENRLSVFCSIINAEDPSSIPDEVKGLLFDFSFNGFFILYYIIEMIYSRQLLSENKESGLMATVGDKGRLNEPYYLELLEQYEKNPMIEKASDGESTENADPDESITPNIPESDIPQFCGWKQDLNRFCYRKLKEIVSADTSENRDIDLEALKYAWYSRKDSDPRGTFFWDVIPRRVIISNIIKEG